MYNVIRLRSPAVFTHLVSNSLKRFWFSGRLISIWSCWLSACAVVCESQRYACTCSGHLVAGLYSNKTQATMSSVWTEHVIAVCGIKCFDEPCKIKVNFKLNCHCDRLHFHCHTIIIIKNDHSKFYICVCILVCVRCAVKYKNDIKLFLCSFFLFTINPAYMYTLVTQKTQTFLQQIVYNICRDCCLKLVRVRSTHTPRVNTCRVSLLILEDHKVLFCFPSRW